MKRFALSLFLTLVVFAASLPSGFAQDEPQDFNPQTYTSLEVSFESELTNYAATHTEAEVLAFAQTRLDQLTTEAVEDPTELQSAQAVTPYAYPDAYYYGDQDPYSDADFQFCMNTRTEECRQQYNAELFASAATSTALFAGCVGLTTGTALIACAAGALAVHALNIAAAKQHYQACLTRAYSDCALAYGGNQ